MIALLKASMVLLLTILMEISLTAQTETHLYLVDVKLVDDCYAVSKPRYLSSFNPCGYTDHPHFTPLGDILVTARRENDNQHDIWLLSPETGSCRRITHTTANEFMPRVTPDGRFYSVVRVPEKDTSNAQVWQFPVFGGKYKRVTPKGQTIGNYAWINENEIGVFSKEAGQNRLSTFNRASQATTRLVTSLATTILSDRMGSLYYIQPYAGNTWFLKKYHHETLNIDILEETPVQSEIMTMSKDGTFFLAHESKIYSYNADATSPWKECADLSMYGIHSISRISISGDGQQMAIVALCE